MTRRLRPPKPHVEISARALRVPTPATIEERRAREPLPYSATAPSLTCICQRPLADQLPLANPSDVVECACGRRWKQR